MKNLETKITKLDNGYLLKVIDLDSDGRIPISKYIAKDASEIRNLLLTIYKDKNHDNK